MKEILVPQLGESITEAVVSKWHFNEGDKVSRDDVLFELETDKVSMEVTAECNGIIQKIHRNEGDSVSIGDRICVIEKKDISKAEEKETDTERNSIKAAKAISEKAPSPIADEAASEDQYPKAPKKEKPHNEMKDKENFAQDTPQSSSQNAEYKQLNEKRVKMSKLRQTIASRLKESQNTAAILTTFNEINMQEVISVRQKYLDKFKEKYDIKLGFMSFFAKAASKALKDFPIINASIEGEDIVYKNYHNIGIAIGSERGLIVPTLKNVESMSFAEVEQNIATFAKKAKEGKLGMSELSNGTFSITNGGIYGSMLSTPIINPPQSAILGMHSIVKRPVVVGEEVRVAPMMYVALSYDHRLIDGSDAIRFLLSIKNSIESPIEMLLDL